MFQAVLLFSHILKELSVDLPEKSEAVCISLSPEHGLVAVGTQNQTNLIDMRVGKTITVIPSIDQDWGISLFLHHLFSSFQVFDLYHGKVGLLRLEQELVL